MWLVLFWWSCSHKELLSEDVVVQLNTSRPNILVDKSEGQLYLVRSGTVVLNDQGAPLKWSVSFGSGVADGDKEREGDKRTPEGLYTYTEYDPHSRYHGSLLIHYPNSDDASRALAKGRIDETLYKQIHSAEQTAKPPPMTTELGGYILVHGTHKDGDSVFPSNVRYIWTDGCVGMSNLDIDELRGELEQDRALDSGKILIVP